MLLSLSALTSLDPASSLFASSLPLSAALLGLVQVGISQETPVKLFNAKPCFCHRLHGFPVLSNALRPALMAPWFAFGPSLWWEGPVVPFGFGAPLVSPSLHLTSQR